MPRGDRTGPTGQGPITGRAAGYCAGYPTPGYANLNPGGGRRMGWRRGGMGFGGGRGFGRGMAPLDAPMPAQAYPYPAYPPPAANSEIECDFLKSQQQALQQQLDAVKQRLDELSTQQEENT